MTENTERMDQSGASGSTASAATAATAGNDSTTLLASTSTLKDAEEAEQLPMQLGLQDYDVQAATQALLDKIPTHDSNGQPLSKNAIKRLKKQAHMDALKPLRRAKERQQKKHKAEQRKLAIKQGTADPNWVQMQGDKKRAAGKRKKEGPFGARVVIDCGFDDMMIEKEVKSMAAQLGYCYSTNRNAARPFDMLITSFNARLRDKFDSIGGKPHEKWKGVEWWDDAWDQLWVDEDHVDQTQQDAPPKENETPIDSAVPDGHGPNSATKERPSTRVPKSSIVYLTGDSPNVLSTLTPGETYILGGIVDHNRYKHLCLDRAERAGVRHAQLPIAEHMPALRTRKVLTVNQVYSILVNYAETKSWAAALEAVMPQRKLVDSNRPAGSGNGDGNGDGSQGDLEDGRDDQDESAPASNLVIDDNDDQDKQQSEPNDAGLTGPGPGPGPGAVTGADAGGSGGGGDTDGRTRSVGEECRPIVDTLDKRAGSKQAKRRRARETAAAAAVAVKTTDPDQSHQEQARQSRRSEHAAAAGDGVYVVEENGGGDDAQDDGHDDGEDDVEAREYEARSGPVPEAVGAAVAREASERVGV